MSGISWYDSVRRYNIQRTIIFYLLNYGMLCGCCCWWWYDINDDDDNYDCCDDNDDDNDYLYWVCESLVCLTLCL